MNPPENTAPPAATTAKKFWSLNVKRGADGSKHLDIHLHGVIDGGWMDDEGVDTSKLIAEMAQHRDAGTIGVRINSIGGSAFGGVALYNALEEHPAQVTCCVEGLAASAASLVAMAGKTCMGRGAMMMIHSPSTYAMGNASELRKTADVLDKVQNALATIYTAKTGKSLDEVNDLLDEETWMTADEAVDAGFADEVVDHAADGDPDFDDPNEGTDADTDGDNDEGAGAQADMVIFNHVAFPRARLPEEVLLMASSPPASATVDPVVVVQQPVAATEDRPALALVPPPEPQPPITRAELALRSPELVSALLEEGRAAGVAAERARLQAIDDLGLKGCAEMVNAAKYGDKPLDARDLAVAAIRAGKQAGAELLEQRRVESRAITEVRAGSPGQETASQQARLVQAMTDGGNAHRGGSR